MLIKMQAEAAKRASYELQSLSTDRKNEILFAIADELLRSAGDIIAANRIDLDKMEDKQSVFYERLTLTAARVDAMVEGVRQIAAIDDPVGKVTAEWTRPSGIHIKKVRAPIGVIAIIYEARPNVTVDAAALCIKSGNAVILRGSRGALTSNTAIYRVMRRAIERVGANPDIVQFIEEESRDAVKELLSFEECIDIVIPRGGEQLKHFILDNSKIPVLASAGGNCHIYVEKTADFDKSINIIVNAKCQRPSVCNAAEHILVDSEIAPVFIPKLCAEMKKNGVEVLGDEEALTLVKDIKAATENDYGTEFMALRLTVKVVSGVNEAVEIINRYGTCHSDAIMSENKTAINIFTSNVEAAAVYVNTSTRFTDGFEFGFGAEMGISTGKMHARGPVGLEQLTSERYIVESDYVIRR